MKDYLRLYCPDSCKEPPFNIKFRTDFNGSYIPSVNQIIERILDTEPELINDKVVLYNKFKEIAIFNGYSESSLADLKYIEKMLSILKSKKEKILRVEPDEEKQEVIESKPTKEYIKQLSLEIEDKSLKSQNGSINTTIKTSVQSIVEKIATDYPALIDNDRAFIAMFDEIALKNGYTQNNLPKYWTIGRSIFNYKKKNEIKADENALKRVPIRRPKFIYVTEEILSKFKFNGKPNIKDIIAKIMEYDSKLADNDRHFSELFDAIALTNGYSAENLPKYWTIGRAVFDYKANSNGKNVKNPNWTREESILLLDLYFRISPDEINSNNQKVIELSQLLNKLPIHSEENKSETFRNPVGIAMKLGNLKAIDPEYKGKGLSAYSKKEELIWNDFYNDREALYKEVQIILDKYVPVGIKSTFSKEVGGQFDHQPQTQGSRGFVGNLLKKIFNFG